MIPVAPFSAPYAEDDVAIAKRLLARQSGRRISARSSEQTDDLAKTLIAAARAQGTSPGIEALLHEYSLSTKEGLALMVLAESLLRVPDGATADRLVEDKLAQGDFAHHEARSDALLLQASAFALGKAAQMLHPGETPQGILASVLKRLGLPVVRVAAQQMVRLLGRHFVLGETIEAALHQAALQPRYSYSFDQLGEGARSGADAERYFDAYAHAIEAVSESGAARAGLSVKLSALHPRYEPLSAERVLKELTPKVVELAQMAKRRGLGLTIDAEEADRLELSLNVFGAAFADASLAGWEGFGLAVQAYQKRAFAVIEWALELAEATERRLPVRLVKGAYWDTEIKRGQERGLADYPVFTRKAMTDLNYMDCAHRLLSEREKLYPQFATHNALTIASIVEAADGFEGYEFQRLHGMGKALYDRLLADHPQAACRIYAPVGGYRDLLAYLVRRLLENGANSSFVFALSDPAIGIETLLQRPETLIGSAEQARSSTIPLPRDLFRPDRCNSAGIDFGDHTALAKLLDEVSKAPFDPNSLIDTMEIDKAVATAHRAFQGTSFPVEERAAALERAADRIEAERGTLIRLLQAEGGKTLDDALSEVREAADFCRYYAMQGRLIFRDQPLPGPTGESNLARLRGRGVFIAISPWNFPLAIFTGQVAAALMAGNSVVAKPAEQTPRTAREALQILHESGVPAGMLQAVYGDGAASAALVSHPAIAGVVFTGSIETARAINRSLAAKDGPIVPLIAETGGINAMIVDATALPEQVADDVIASAFRSAGQRCSALRLLCLQEDVADRMLDIIIGAAKELSIGDTRELSVRIGPVIDGEAKAKLEAHIALMKRTARCLYAGEAPDGLYVAPHVFELDHPSQLTDEAFGPILHVVRYQAHRLDELLDALEAGGYGLTLGVQSRIDAFARKIASRLTIGNVYVNRNMIGAVVGVQPFGGHGLSGTGPKAGGKYYLPRFAVEQTLTINTSAAGGNATLLAQQ